MSPNTAPIATQIDGWLTRQGFPSEVGTATVVEKGCEGAIIPSPTGGLTCPWPVPNRVIVEPFAAGFAGPLGRPSWFRIAPAPLPSWLTVKRPGEEAAKRTVPPATSSPVSSTRTAKRADPNGAELGT